MVAHEQGVPQAGVLLAALRCESGRHGARGTSPQTQWSLRRTTRRVDEPARRMGCFYAWVSPVADSTAPAQGRPPVLMTANIVFFLRVQFALRTIVRAGFLSVAMGLLRVLCGRELSL